ncbi:MAG: hypothetical protein MJ211_01490 [Bacteroidales bacterium]|nr:hypothetical protein [Bacteroidales bacterium]
MKKFLIAWTFLTLIAIVLAIKSRNPYLFLTASIMIFVNIILYKFIKNSDNRIFRKVVLSLSQTPNNFYTNNAIFELDGNVYQLLNKNDFLILLSEVALIHGNEINNFNDTNNELSIFIKNHTSNFSGLETINEMSANKLCATFSFKIPKKYENKEDLDLIFNNFHAIVASYTNNFEEYYLLSDKTYIKFIGCKSSEKKYQDNFGKWCTESINNIRLSNINLLSWKFIDKKIYDNIQ